MRIKQLEISKTGIQSFGYGLFVKVLTNKY